MGAPLFSITYTSAATDPFSDADLTALLAQSRRANEGNGLTGMLLYRSGRFLQVLEGPEPGVRETIDRIGRDPRHGDMRILVEEPIEQRHFADWTMGYEPIGVPSTPPPEGFRDTFDDLDSTDATVTDRALAALAVWFRVRSAQR